MTNIGVVRFNTGEISPKIEARSDTEKFIGGCRRLENMIPDIFGNVTKRPGTEFIATSVSTVGAYGDGAYGAGDYGAT